MKIKNTALLLLCTIHFPFDIQPTNYKKLKREPKLKYKQVGSLVTYIIKYFLV